MFLANNRLGIEFLDTSDGDAQELFLHSVAIKESNCMCVWKAKPQEVDGVLLPSPPSQPYPAPWIEDRKTHLFSMRYYKVFSV